MLEGVLKIKSWADQIEHSVALYCNVSLKELCCPGAMILSWALQTHFILCPNRASMIKDLVFI